MQHTALELRGGVPQAQLRARTAEKQATCDLVVQYRGLLTADFRELHTLSGAACSKEDPPLIYGSLFVSLESLRAHKSELATHDNDGLAAAVGRSDRRAKKGKPARFTSLE